MIVAQCCSEGGEEVLETGGAGDAMVAKGEDVGLGVAKGGFDSLQLRHRSAFVNIGFSSFDC